VSLEIPKGNKKEYNPPAWRRCFSSSLDALRKAKKFD